MTTMRRTGERDDVGQMARDRLDGALRDLVALTRGDQGSLRQDPAFADLVHAADADLWAMVESGGPHRE